ncbi:MAG: saccharopine dehydrogenase NADP-binding domain-containing protein [Thermoplasmatales archaeon]|nr:MAG: saccharopine dehydrogenase NADP-binding domain-containing protein [Thermoplasmatales archaeon]
MKIVVIGAGMMGRAIAYDLEKYSNFETLTIADMNKKAIQNVKNFLKSNNINYEILDISKKNYAKKLFQKNDVVVSAIPYFFNFELTKIAIETKTHFLDLGGNNDVVNQQINLFNKAKKNNITVIPDCGLSPGLTSIITHDIVDDLDIIESVKIRVGGLPLEPKPPFNYQIVFSPNGLINEYVEEGIILENGKIKTKSSLTELEEIVFPEPFGKLEAFITSGGTSTLPFTYKDKIKYLDEKTIRYPGHCEKFKLLLEMGLGNNKPLKIGNKSIVPRDLLIELLLKNIPTTGEDVVLCKVIGKGMKNNEKIEVEYTIIDYFDKEHNITAMMRTTGYPVSILAQMIEQKIINKHGVFSNEEIVLPKLFFKDLEKRNINVNKEINKI